MQLKQMPTNLSFSQSHEILSNPTYASQRVGRRHRNENWKLRLYAITDHKITRRKMMKKKSEHKMKINNAEK